MHILETKKAHFDPVEIRGPLRERPERADQGQAAGKEPPEPPEPQPSNVINLMDALRRSAQGDERQRCATAGKRAGQARARAKSARQARRAASAAQEVEEGELRRVGTEDYRAKRKFDVTRRAARQGGAASAASFCHPEARGDAAAL